MITQEICVNLFDYKNGNLYCKQKNKKIGFLKKGYMQVRIFHKTYSVHRIVFLMHHGYLPEMIDHINGIINDNRIENLRKATNRQNQQNRKLCLANKSGVKNVSWDNGRKKWCVRLKVENTHKNFGRFDDLELAELVAIEARNKYHKEFARHK